MPQKLDLKEVSFVSLVDDPEVGAAEFIAAKRDGNLDDLPEDAQAALGQIQKDGRVISQSNLETLADIHSTVSSQHPQAAQELEGFLREAARDEEQLDQLLGDQHMGDNPDIEELVESVEKATEAASEAAEAASEAAQAASPEGPEGGSDGEEPTIEELQEQIQALEEAQEGGQEEPEGEEQEVPEAAQERINSLEETLVEEGVLSEDEVTDWEEAQEGGQSQEESGEEVPEEMEKRLSTIEKALENGGERQGQASALDNLDDSDTVSKSTGAKDIKSRIQEEG